MSTWALQRYLGCWRASEVPSSVLPRCMPLFLWTRPLLDSAMRETVPVGPPALRSTPSSTEGAERRGTSN
jgi:hypothetical protein